ncbi:transcription factor bHLH68-like [Lolium rigidum]|uniref:transcription factor bHLH68-like n=1 Tax=Lolium rigidum TaxID=89674 RepID=UPI001F5C8142|nr:transcription factor bHLH68-like [Lolium rigidum]
MDRGLIHKSSPLVGEMGEGHGWWSVNNLRPPFEQHNPSILLPSTTAASSSSHISSFSSLLLSNHYPLPTTSTAPWHDSSSSNQGQQLQDPWSHLVMSPGGSGGLANSEERYKNWEGQALFPTGGEEAEDRSSAGYSYRATVSHGRSQAGDEIQLAMSSPPPWARGIQQHHNTLQQQASSPRSSSITSTTSLGSSMFEFSNHGSPRECLSTASGTAFKKARTQEPSPAQSIVKVRKEKLGDRITALHQLVSPFGKTDTASVLLEAIGYIRFLHGQIEGLSSPYQLGGGNGSGGGSMSKQQHEATAQQGERNNIFPEEPGQLLHDKASRKRGHPDQDVSCSGEEAKKDLKSRGLCLVPVSCTLDFGADAGPADYWTAAPPFGMGFGR